MEIVVARGFTIISIDSSKPSLLQLNLKIIKNVKRLWPIPNKK